MKTSIKRSALLLATLLAAPALAQNPGTTTTLATGFNSPMGVLVAPDGNVWVVDSGTGGDQQLETTNPETGEKQTASVGNTARVIRVSLDGTLTEVATLPSVLMGQEATGGARLALLGDAVYVTSGVWAEVTGPEAMPLMASVVEVQEDGAREVANIWTYESAENPDGFVKEAHPYGLAVGPDEMLYIADAGANNLVKVDVETGKVTLVATFEGIPSPIPNPARGGAKESDPVPTGIAFGEDGTIYVSMLPGFPFTPGSAKVVAVDTEGNISDYATGLTMVTDLRLGPDGALYAVQLGEFTKRGPTPNTGTVVRIQDGRSVAVLEGLSFPTSIDFAEDGSAYLTLNGVGAPGSGELVTVPATELQASR